MPLSPIITSEGLAAAFNADNNGLSANITHVVLGDTAWTPTTEAIELQNERNRVTISNGTRLQPNQIHLTAIENGDVEYWIREIGFLLEDGTLFAVWSESDAALAFKAAGVDVLLAFDLLLESLPSNSVEIVGTGGVNLPSATNAIVGLMRFATTEEQVQGSTVLAAVTPEGVRMHGDARYSQLAHIHSWEQITGRPTVFPPRSHRHVWGELDNIPETFTPAWHRHNWTEIDNRPSVYPPSHHVHSWPSITARPETFPPSSHRHNWTELDGRPVAFPPSNHEHSFDQISNRPKSFVLQNDVTEQQYMLNTGIEMRIGGHYLVTGSMMIESTIDNGSGASVQVQTGTNILGRITGFRTTTQDVQTVMPYRRVNRIVDNTSSIFAAFDTSPRIGTFKMDFQCSFLPDRNSEFLRLFFFFGTNDGSPGSVIQAGAVIQVDELPDFISN